MGVNPDGVPKIQELRRKIEDENVSSTEYENAVFSHLLNFFSRYYDSGDLLAKGVIRAILILYLMLEKKYYCIGQMAGIGGRAFLSPIICGSRRNPVDGS